MQLAASHRLHLQRPKPQKNYLQEVNLRKQNHQDLQPRKLESPRPALPKAKAEPPQALAKATIEEPAQKKAALTSVHKPLPAAKLPATPSATAKLMEQSAKPPPKETPPKPSEAAATTAPKSHGAGSIPKSHGVGSTPKSLGKETAPKQQPAAPKRKLSLQWGSRLALAQGASPRRSKDRFSVTCADSHLKIRPKLRGRRLQREEKQSCRSWESLTISKESFWKRSPTISSQPWAFSASWFDKPRGRPNQSCQKSPCSCSGQGLQQHLGEVFTRCSFCSKLAQWRWKRIWLWIHDLLRHGHLPKVDRTRAQMQLGISEQSQLEHKATRLVYLDVHDQNVPDRFHYIGQSWLFMYRTEIYSEEEYIDIDYLKRHPENNLLMTNMGMIEISVDEADRHLAWVKNQNRESYRKNGEDKRKAVWACKSAPRSQNEGRGSISLWSRPCKTWHC